MKTITVKAAPRPDYAGYWCAHRFFPNGTDVVLEVLDQEEDPPPIMAPEKGHPERMTERPDPYKIGLRSERQLRANTSHLVVISGGDMPIPPTPEVTIAEQQKQIAELMAKVEELTRLIEAEKRPASPGRSTRGRDDG